MPELTLLATIIDDLATRAKGHRFLGEGFLAGVTQKYLVHRLGFSLCVVHALAGRRRLTRQAVDSASLKITDAGVFTELF